MGIQPDNVSWILKSQRLNPVRDQEWFVLGNYLKPWPPNGATSHSVAEIIKQFRAAFGGQAVPPPRYSDRAPHQRISEDNAPHDAQNACAARAELTAGAMEQNAAVREFRRVHLARGTLKPDEARQWVERINIGKPFITAEFRVEPKEKQGEGAIVALAGPFRVHTVPVPGVGNVVVRSDPLRDLERVSESAAHSFNVSQEQAVEGILFGRISGVQRVRVWQVMHLSSARPEDVAGLNYVETQISASSIEDPSPREVALQYEQARRLIQPAGKPRMPVARRLRMLLFALTHQESGKGAMNRWNAMYPSKKPYRTRQNFSRDIKRVVDSLMRKNLM